MSELLSASLTFPTVVFTVGLGIALVYWLFVLLGALDIDLFHGGDVGGDGIDVGGHVDVGGHDVGGHDVGGHDAGGDGGDGGDHDAGDGGGGGIWHALGLGVIPLTISISVIMLVGWCGSLLVMYYFGDLGRWLAAVVLPGMIIVAIPFTALLLRPLRRTFTFKEGKSNRDYVGHLCTITTGTVDNGFGQATLEDGGNVLEIPVRCDRSGALVRGHRALIIDFDEAREAYVVEPSADMIAEPSKHESESA